MSSTTFANRPVRTPLQIHTPGEVRLIASPLNVTDQFGTSDHMGFPTDMTLHTLPQTTWVRLVDSVEATVAAEVRRMRDRMIALTGLGKQDIARGIGVDRRSLSGYVSGEIRPPESRLRKLRHLDAIAEWSAERFGEHARELLRGDPTATSPLDLIAAEEPEIRDVLEAAAQALSPTITIRSRRARPSLDVHALAIWAEHLDLPSRVGVPREEALYEQDLSQVARSLDPPPRPHRREI